MSSANGLSNSTACINYLSRVLELRVSELRTANRSLAWRSRNVESQNHPLGSCGQSSIYENSDGKVDETVTGSVTCLLEQLEDLSNKLLHNNVELTELRSKLDDVECKLKNSLCSHVILEAQVQQGELIRKAKEDEIEELLMLHQSASDSIMELKCANLDLNKRFDESEKLNDFYRSELETLKKCVDTKEECIAQLLFEKDDLEETNASYKNSNSTLSQEISRLEAFFRKETEEKQKALDEKKLLEFEKVQFLKQLQVLDAKLGNFSECAAASDVEKVKYLEQMEVMGGEGALYQQGADLPLCSQLTDVTNSQQMSQLTMTKFELTTVLAEKEELEQLELCKTEFQTMKNSCTCQRKNSLIITNLEKRLADLDAENVVLRASIEEKSDEFHRLNNELLRYKSLLGNQENQNTELIGQLLLLEDRLAESEVLIHDSRESADQLALTAVEATNSSVQLREQVGSLSAQLETAENALQCCTAELDLLRCKYKTVSERYQHLLTNKNLLDKTHHLLVEKVNTLQNENSVSSTCLACIDRDQLRPDFQQLQNSCRKLSKELHMTQVRCRQLEVEKVTVKSAILRDIVSDDLQKNSSSHATLNISSSPEHGFQSDKDVAQIKIGKVTNTESRETLAVIENEIDTHLIDEMTDDFEAVHNVENSCKRRATPSSTTLKPQYESRKRQLFNESSVVSPKPAVSVGYLHCDQSMSTNTANDDCNVALTTPQGRKRNGGRVSLSLSRRSPKTLL